MNNKAKNFVIYILITILLSAPCFVVAENIEMKFNSSTLSEPNLVINPSSHNFGYVYEGQQYFTTFEIWNGGSGTLTWELNTSQSWLTYQPTNGSSTGEHDTVNVCINTTGLSSGYYTGAINISSNSTSLSITNNSFIVTFTVNEPPLKPNKPNGPSTGEVDVYYTYSTSTTDPNGDDVAYGLDINGDDIVDHWSSMSYPSGFEYSVNIKFYYAGTYYLRFKAKDEHGAHSDFSNPKIIYISGENHAPETPTMPTGPATGKINTTYTFTTSTIDPDGDDVQYGWDWNGDNIIDQWTGFYESGLTVSLSHLYNSSGTYNIKVVAKDENGAQSGFSMPRTIVITGNTAPEKPTRPNGPISGRAGVSYIYSSSTTDLEGHNIYYLFDWGDGTKSGWIGPYSSGDIAAESYTWSNTGTFAVKVKAKDDPNGDGDLSDGSESVWSETLPISMPKNKDHVPINVRFYELYQSLIEFIQSLRTW